MNSFKGVEDYLNSLINYEVAFPLGGSRDRPKLAPVYAACERLALPLVLPKCLHIAGTVGKGSTAAFAQALLSVHHNVLSFTSPHLVTPKERVRMNGEDMPDEVWCEGIEFIREGIAREPQFDLTYFETTFVFYLWCAQKLGTSAHVVETGLGGSFDATNVLLNTTAVLTKIDLDHTQILGKTIAEIARDKSGIIKPNGTCFISEQDVEALLVLDEAALTCNSKLFVEGRDFRVTNNENSVLHFSFGKFEADVKIPLTGEFQKHNLAVAMAAVKSMDESLSEGDAQTVLLNLKLEARQQTLAEYSNVMVDVCHNPASFKALADTLNRDQNFARRIVLVAMMKDKDARASLHYFHGVADELWVTDAPTPRSLSREELGQIAAELGFNVRVVEREAAYQDILALRADTRGVVCGSFYLVGDFLRMLRNA